MKNLAANLKLADFNQLKDGMAVEELMKCCSSRNWAVAMAKARPFSNMKNLLEKADQTWQELGEKDWLEAFLHHPRIGEKALKEKFSSTSEWASEEQKGVKRANEGILGALLKGNQDYERRFGHIFLICATGKSAQEMLSSLKQRLKNDPDKELKIAAVEQAKITRIRLEKLLK